ncbi:MAG: hypothetical protein LBR82_00885 [Desulfovibrio sp.]|jgi:hypothetical protein|nr:hypothetical protein [Desulfovibrio sp.]
MSVDNHLHDEALRCAQRAEEALSAGQQAEASRYFLEAASFEEQAAASMSAAPENEPMRAGLYRDAASFAGKGRDLSYAERLCAFGLAGFPPPELRNDLFQLMDDITRERLWGEQAPGIRGAALSMRLYGSGIRFGSAPVKAVMKRVDSLTGLFARTTQRIAERPYADLRKKDPLARPFMTEMAVDAPGSFGVTLKLSRLAGEQISFFQPDPQDVLNDIVSNIACIASGDFETLQKNIPDESYLVNFIAAVKEIAPDGNIVKSVGLSTKTKNIAFTAGQGEIKRTARAAVAALGPAAPRQYPEKLTGYLDIVDRKNGTLALTSDEGKVYKAEVKSGLEEVARKYFGCLVEVEYTKKRRAIILSDISSLEDAE